MHPDPEAILSPSASLYESLFARAERDTAPISALVELTHACNLDCEHCYLDLQSDRKIGALSTDEWKRIFRELAEEGTLFLTLSGGELLSRRDWFELASYARQLGFALRLFTNATLIDEATADRIASLCPLGVEVSLHGATAATQDAITRQPGSFERTLRGGRLLRARGVPLILKCVIMRRNVDEYPRLRELAAALDAEIQFDVEVTPKNDGSRAPTELAIAEEQRLFEVVREIQASSTGCAQSTHFDRAARLAGAPCGAGRRTCHIGPTGNLHPCTQWTTPVGNLRQHSFAALWRHDPTFDRIRAIAVGSLDGCRSCELLEACSPCMALSLLENENLDGPSPTRCRSTTARARARGIAGTAAGSLEPKALVPLVQLRRAARR